ALSGRRPREPPAGSSARHLAIRAGAYRGVHLRRWAAVDRSVGVLARCGAVLVAGDPMDPAGGYGGTAPRGRDGREREGSARRPRRPPARRRALGWVGC